MVSFVHTGDIHLGLQFKGILDPSKAIEKRSELWTTFQRIVAYTIEKKTDFLFIAGDLFEKEYFTLGDIKRVRDILGTAEGVNVIMIAGNHDYLDNRSLYKQVEWPENVTIFDFANKRKKVFKDLNTIVYGYSWDNINFSEELPLEDFKADKDFKNVLLLHGDIGRDSKYLPLDINVLEDLKMDYIALGHIHKPEIIRKNIAYSGCPEPLDFGEMGARGFMEGSIGEGKTIVKFVPFSKREYIIEEISINEDMGYMDIVAKVRDIEKNKRDKDFFRLIMSGYRDKDINLNSLYADLKDEFYHLELVDKTLPDYDLETMEKDYEDNIIGLFINDMKARNLNDKNIKDGLYYGLQALLKGKIDI